MNIKEGIQVFKHANVLLSISLYFKGCYERCPMLYQRMLAAFRLFRYIEQGKFFSLYRIRFYLSFVVVILFCCFRCKCKINAKLQANNFGEIIKNCFMLSMRISSYGCAREVWRARKRRKSCSRRNCSFLSDLQTVQVHS